VSSPQGNDQSQTSAASSSTAKPRVGSLVAFSHPDPLHPEGKPITGEAVVLYVTDDGTAAAIAPLSDLHLWTATENLVAPVKPADVQVNVPIPDTSAASS
jgi:hypothetical protein